MKSQNHSVVMTISPSNPLYDAVLKRAASCVDIVVRLYSDDAEDDAGPVEHHEIFARVNRVMLSTDARSVDVEFAIIDECST